jgi:hypothetical protein
MTELGKYSSFSDADGNPIHWPEPIGTPKPIADIHIVRDRREGYIFELDGQLLDDGTTRPTREPRVAPIMAAYLRFGDGQPFTLREAISATYDAGRHPGAMRYASNWNSPELVKEAVIRDHWVLANTSDTLSTATRCHLQIVLRDAVITLEKLSRGVYMFHLNPPSTVRDTSGLISYADFVVKYQTKFEREGIK